MILDDGMILRCIKDNSIERECYVHSNGFVKITFVMNRTLHRLHVWNSSFVEKVDTERTPHTHPWSFDSEVVAGSLTCEFFSEERGSTFTKFCCEALPIPGEGHRNYKVGQVNLSSYACFSLEKGSRYKQSSKVIHDVYPTNELICATLVKKETVEEVSSFLYSKKREKGRVKNINISRRLVNSVAEEVLFYAKNKNAEAI